MIKNKIDTIEKLDRKKLEELFRPNRWTRELDHSG
jgi:hypothetical protein